MTPADADPQLITEGAPLVNGIDWTTGETLPPPSPFALIKDIDTDPDDVRRRAETGGEFGLSTADIEDPDDLRQTGWGVLFGANVRAEVKAQLTPLLEHRAKQAHPFKVFEGVHGSTAEDVRRWLAEQNVGFATVNPAAGVPFYLLIVASPEDISFEFQYMLDTYWAVGRLHFDSTDGYQRYAEQVVDYETASAVAISRTVGIFAPRNPGDRSTTLLFHQVVRPLAEGAQLFRPLGERQNFTLRIAVGEEATKDNLRAMLAGSGGSRPAFLFTGSHGAYANATVPNRLDRIGSLVTQEWEGAGSPLSEACCYSAVDLERDNSDLRGLIHFSFACYSAGCPTFDTYALQLDGTRRRLLDNNIVSRLPQRSLERGALAVLGHVDRAFSYSFHNDRFVPQIQDMREVMVNVLRGWRIGRATDQFNLRWAVLSAALSDALRDGPHTGISEAALATQWVARDDARNYVILGDPAVRLRVEDMK